MKYDAEKWRADYARDGYLVVPDCLDAQTLSVLREKTDHIQNNIDKLPPHLRGHIALEKEFLKHQPDKNDLPAESLGKAIKLVMELPHFDPAFAELICFQPLLDVLKVIFGSTEFSFHNYKAIIKPPTSAALSCGIAICLTCSTARQI